MCNWNPLHSRVVRERYFIVSPNSLTMYSIKILGKLTWGMFKLAKCWLCWTTFINILPCSSDLLFLHWLSDRVDMRRNWFIPTVLESPVIRLGYLYWNSLRLLASLRRVRERRSDFPLLLLPPVFASGGIPCSVIYALTLWPVFLQ